MKLILSIYYKLFLFYVINIETIISDLISTKPSHDVDLCLLSLFSMLQLFVSRNLYKKKFTFSSEQHKNLSNKNIDFMCRKYYQHLLTGDSIFNCFIIFQMQFCLVKIRIIK